MRMNNIDHRNKKVRSGSTAGGQASGLTGMEVAVIGMAGRFPGSANIEEFWENLKQGKEMITFFPDKELEEAGVGGRELENPNYVRAKGVLAGIEYFDAAFFGYTPGDARIMDPQIRIFHECAWAALEDAGYNPETYEDLIGLYAGASSGLFWQESVLLSGLTGEIGAASFDSIGDSGSLPDAGLNDRDYLCTRISYKLNLKGPSTFIHTTCSTSLVAIHMASRALLTGECRMALAGGVSVSLPQKCGYLYEEGMIMSPDGHCRPFDAAGRGTLKGDGVGIVVLKSLKLALADGDYIYAVIKGSAINNDGWRKVGYTAPSVEGQAEVIRYVMRMAKVEPESIGYIETHGTATELGDPVEIKGLKLAFNTDKKGFCALGAVKSNVGHLDTAAGAAGFIKTVLALQHRLIPPTLHFQCPNPNIDFINSPFYVNTELREWESEEYPLRAGVSSFGLGGTNAHIILEEAPEIPVTDASSPSRKHQLLVLSAKSVPALDQVTHNLANYLKKNLINPDHPVNPGLLADVAYTLQVGRKHFEHRRFLVCATAAEAVETLSSADWKASHSWAARELDEPGGNDRGLIELEKIPGSVFTGPGPGAQADQQVINLLNKLGELWGCGKQIDWSGLYAQEKRHRVPLPTYPFERQHYWIESQPFNIESLASLDLAAAKQPEFSDWFSIPSWKRSPLPTAAENAQAAEEYWLVFPDAHGLGTHVATRLRKEGHRVVTVTPGPDFNKPGEDSYRINPAKEKDYITLFAEPGTAGKLPSHVLHFWGVYQERVGFSEAQDRGFYSLLYLAKALGKGNVGITVVTSHMQEVSEEDVLYPEKAAVLGPVKVIPQEHPGLTCRSIDIILPKQGTWQWETLIDRLWDEFFAKTADTVVAFRGKHRWVETFEPVRLENPPSATLPLREKGVYLITGGPGEIGLVLARYLAESFQARLILTGRSWFPAEDRWDHWLSTHNEEDSICRKIKKVQELELLGGEVLVFTADAADYDRMKQVVLESEQHFGPINGIIHGAGIRREKILSVMRELEKERCEEHFRPKVQGLLVLDELFKNKDLDFCWLISSISCVLGGLGFAAHAAANSFMDAFAALRSRESRRSWLSVNWDGMEADKTIDGFRRTLTLKEVNRVVVANGGNLQDRINKWVKLESLRENHADIKKDSSGLKPRPRLKTPYTAPATPGEQAIAGVWQGLFGYEQIGTRDDFFELGGDSLKAITVISRIHKVLDVKIPVTEFFERLTIASLAEYIDKAEKSTYSSILPAEAKEYYVLSSAQKRLYILQQLEKESLGYNEPQVVRLEGKLDKERLQAAFGGLIGRHENLRASIIIPDEEPVQKIHRLEEIGFTVEYYEITGVESSDNAGKECQEILRSFIRPFDLGCAPFMRAALIKLREETYVLVIDKHHIITDGISHGIFWQEFTALYNGEELPPLGLQYKDYAQWQNSKDEKQRVKQQEAYWLNQYKGDIPVLNLPLDYSRPAQRSFEGGITGSSISKEERRALEKLALSEDATLYMVLLGIFYVVLSKLCGQEDVVMGTPTVGRIHAELDPIIGMFSNTLALRNYPSGEKSFKDFLKQLKDRTLEAFENQEYQFEDLVDNVSANREAGRNPLFDVMFVFQNRENPGMNLSGVTVTPFEHENNISKFDLSFMGIDDGDNLFVSFEYSTLLFKEKTMKRFINYFKKTVSFLVRDPKTVISEIEIMEEDEKKQVLFEFNQTAAAYPGDKTIHDLFAEQTEKTPEKMALVGSWQLAIGKEKRNGEMVQLTYGKLNKRSDQVARVLKEKGVLADDIIGIMTERSVEMIIGILGILKAGGAYLPIDAEYPQERIDYMLKDSNALLLFTGLELLDVCKGTACCAPTASPATCNLHLSLAYVLYTSGTTGRPKGVMVKHRNVVRLVKNTNYVEFRVGGRVLQTAALEFDASTFEIWGSLLNGLTLYLTAKDEVLDGVMLKGVIRKYDIETMWLTSPLFNRLCGTDVEIFSGLRNLLVGGDVLSPVHIDRVKKRFPGLNIINGYGPTENTTFSTTFLITGDYTERIPIGKPIANSTAYIVDRWNKLVLVGVVGELYVGGDGVSRGYLNDPKLTAEKFISLNTQHVTCNTIYRTGDLARWLEDGNIEFLGRIDQQVKIRGFRVELGEIESRLSGFAGIEEAVIISTEDKKGDKYLCAYFTAENEIPIPRLKEYLSAYLPGYMVPGHFIQLEKIPLTPNGKLDRKALPEPGFKAGEDYKAPGNKVEEKLVEIWSEVLGIEGKAISINHDFFELGGHSLKAVQVLSKIHKELNARVPLVELFTVPTVEGLARYIKEAAEETYAAVEVTEKKEYYVLSSAQKRLYILKQAASDSIDYNIPQIIPLTGEVKKEKLEDTFKKLIERHESLRTCFCLVDDHPVQKVHEPHEVEFAIEYYNADIIQNFVRPFDLTKAPLLRVELLETGEEKHLLLLDLHHIITDGTSQEILKKDFMCIYQGEELPCLRLQYKDYAEWQWHEKGKEALKRQEEFWLKEFEGGIPLLDLPFDFPRPGQQTSESDRLVVEIDQALGEKIRGLVLKTGATLYHVLLAAYNVLLSKYTGQEDIVVGTVVAGRRHVDLEKIIGMFVNMVPIRNNVNENQTFGEFLEKVKQNAINAFENQDYPFEELVNKLGKQGVYNRNPLFDTVFVLQNFEYEEVGRNAAADDELPPGANKTTTPFDLHFIAYETGGAINLEMLYKAALFEFSTLEKILGHYIEILRHVVEDEEVKLKEILLSYDALDARIKATDDDYNNFAF